MGRQKSTKIESSCDKIFDSGCGVRVVKICMLGLQGHYIKIVNCRNGITKVSRHDINLEYR